MVDMANGKADDSEVHKELLLSLDSKSRIAACRHIVKKYSVSNPPVR
jgi:hypothetical protein